MLERNELLTEISSWEFEKRLTKEIEKLKLEKKQSLDSQMAL